MAEVEVKLISSYGSGYGFSVRVRSTKDPSVKAGGVIEPGSFSSPQELLLRVRTLAGAAAEHLAIKYGENHNADLCARQAEESLKAELRIISDIGSSYGNKIRIMESRVSSLPNKEQEVLHRISRAYKRDNIAVPIHEKWLDGAIRRSSN